VGREWVVVLITAVVVLLVATSGRRSGRGSRSTAGHYDPDAIGRYTLDPATQAYRLELPNLAPSGKPIAPGSGPPHRRRRRGKRLTDGTSG
jgi:hypothetical protein